MNSTLNQPMLITTNRIQTIIQSRGSITLSELESILDASYNLIFRAIYHLSPENRRLKSPLPGVEVALASLFSLSFVLLCNMNVSLENIIKVRKGEWDFIISKS